MVETQKSNFYQAVRDYNEYNRGHPQYEVWLNYALSTNKRGQFVVDLLDLYTLSLRSKRHLDIGCGYGGVCIAAAKAGACSVGLDLDTKLIEFSELNKRDHPDLNPTFYKMDVLDTENVIRLGIFDIITCDNVIEHVSDPERLVKHISLLLKKTGFAYVTIPNAYSIGQVRKDSHYGLFGISLLDSADAAVYVKQVLQQPSYGVSYYYNYEQYLNLFHNYGLYIGLYSSLAVDKKSIDELLDQGLKLQSEYQELLTMGRIPGELSGKIEQTLNTYLQQLSSRYLHFSRLPAGPQKAILRRQLFRDYVNEVWFIIATGSPMLHSLRTLLSIGKRSIRLISRKYKK